MKFIDLSNTLGVAAEVLQQICQLIEHNYNYQSLDFTELKNCFIWCFIREEIRNGLPVVCEADILCEKATKVSMPVLFFSDQTTNANNNGQLALLHWIRLAIAERILAYLVEQMEPKWSRHIRI